MFEEFIGHLQVLSKVDALIARIWLNVLARRFALMMLAALIATFGLAMADIAGFYAFRGPFGPVAAAAIVALADFVVAVAIIAATRLVKPGREMDSAQELRAMAIKSLQSDAAELEETVRGLTQQLRDTKDSIVGLASHPLDAAARALIIPALIAIVKAVRSRHHGSGKTGDQATE
jgi:hypothetical protein